jgi:TRAP-type C4-dicarboxylate transport system permease small subunit
LKTILRLYSVYRPMRFYGMIAVFLAALSILLFIPVGAEYIETGLVPRYPTLFVCGFLMIAALQSFFAGLQLNTGLQKNRQDFEMELIRAGERKRELEREK